MKIIKTSKSISHSFGKRTKNYSLVSLSLLVVAWLSFCGISSASAATSTLNLTLSDSNITMNIAPTSTNGSFSKSSTSTISASTNNATGYTLSIAASSSNANASKLINTSDSTSALNSITSATTEEQFKALSATTYNNMWGYLPSKYCSDGTNATCTTNTSFLPAPSVSGDILDQTSTANTTANNYTIAIGARIDSTTKTGTYQNTYVVKLVANAIPYSIIYDDNVVSNMPTDISSTTPDASVAIDSKVPVRSGYKFLGWCTTIPTNNDGTDTCTGGTTYQPSSNISINQTGTGNDFHLYAMWQEICAGYTKMQNMTTASAAIILPNTGSTATVCDTRDETKYVIGKLADGKIWLLDNLALDLTSSTILNGMNESNTNASNTTLGYLKNGGGTTSDKYAITGVVNWTDSPTYASSNSYSDPLVNLTNKDIVPTDATSTAGGYKVGGYYNYCAASAGSYCYGNGASSGIGSGDATEDICPKGWRMPAGNTTGQYSTLAQAIYGTTGSTYDATAYANYRSALRLPLPGPFSNGSARYQGQNGYFWSSTHYNDYFVYYLSLLTNNVGPANYGDRSIGYSVRCILGS